MAAESLSGQSGWAPTGLGPGSLVAGYRVESRIGAGGMAMVLRARDEALGRTVALKILTPALVGDAEFRERFIRESRAVAAVDHPHIIPVYAAGEADGVLYLAMRFVGGGDLRSVGQREGPLHGGQAVALLSPLPRRWTPRTRQAWYTATSSRPTSSSTPPSPARSTRTCRTSGSPSAQRHRTG